MIALRPTSPDDLPALSAFYADRFGQELTLEAWQWKYRAIPGEARSFVAIEEEEGRVLAHAGALCLPARWRSALVGIWQLVDFAGLPSGRGLRPALVDLGDALLADLPREGEAPWIFGFPSQRHFRLGERVFGYRPLATVDELEGALPEAAVPAGVEIASGDSCAAWAEAAWERCGVCGIRRSVAFLNWRYYARPARYYRFYRLRSGETDGLAVFAFVHDEAWAAELWLPSAEDWLPSLLAVAADLRASGLRRWRFWPPPAGDSGEGVGRALAALGLTPSGERRFLGCRGGRSGFDPVAAAAGFTYAMGDYDLV